MENETRAGSMKHPRLTKLMNNPIVWATLSILSILGIILTVITFFPSIKKQITYAVNSRVVLAPDQSILNDLEITYLGKKVDYLRSTDIRIWNSGVEAIKVTDLATLCPLVIDTKQSENIYSVSIVDFSNENNKISYEWTYGDSNIKINFEYMNPNDYVIVQVLHTVPFTFRVDSEIIGSGEKSVKLYDERNEVKKAFIINDICLGAIVLFSIIFGGILVIKKRIRVKLIVLYIIIVAVLIVIFRLSTNVINEHLTTIGLNIRL